MRKKRRVNTKIWGVVIAVILIISGGLVIVSSMMQSKVIDTITPETTEKSEEGSYLDNSVLNGEPFEEDFSYSEYDDTILHYAYITVLPTADDITGQRVTMDDLNAVTLASGADPIVEVFFQDGDETGPEGGIYESTVIRANATMKVRGFSSRNAEQKSFKVSLSGVAGTYLGQETLNFNKHAYDPIRFSNKFCMDALEDIPWMGSLDTYFVKIYIRDLSKGTSGVFEDYGMFTMVEQPNKLYLERHGLNKNSTIYKPKLFGFYMYDALKSESDPAYDEAAFEEIIEIRENADHDKLIEMVEAVNDTSRDINDVVDTYFNRDNYLTWMATNIIFGNMDAVVHNYLLYSPVNSKTWYFLPWDYDGTLAYAYREIYERKDVPADTYGLGIFWGSPLHNRFFRDPDNLKALNEKIDTIMRDYLSNRDCQKITAHYLEMFESSMFIQPDIRYLTGSVDNVAYYTENTYLTMRQLVDLYYDNLESPLPIFMALPTKKGGDYHFAWDSSYDFQGGVLTYRLDIARDPGFRNIVFTSEPTVDTQMDVTLNVPRDTYFFRVIITDEDGNTQTDMEYYDDPLTGDEYPGVMAFEVQ